MAILKQTIKAYIMVSIDTSDIIIIDDKKLVVVRVISFHESEGVAYAW